SAARTRKPPTGCWRWSTRAATCRTSLPEARRAPLPAATSQSGSRASSNRFRIDETAPARAAERLPLPFRLGEAIRDRIDGRRIVAESAVTAVHLDAFAPGCAFLDAALPGADAVASAVDGARGHRRRLGKRTREGDPLIVDAVSAGEFVQSPSVRGSRVAGERTAERDHGPDVVGHSLCDLAREDAAQAPADQADLCSIAAAQVANSIEDPLLQSGEIAVVAPQLPPVRGISVVGEKASQRPG